MRNYIATALVALVIGASIGLYLGWVQFPREYQDGYLCQLDIQYQEAYTIMVARGYRQDGDETQALERLKPLLATNVAVCAESSNQINDIPAWVETVTLKYITTSPDPTVRTDLALLAVAFGSDSDLIKDFLPEETQP